MTSSAVSRLPRLRAASLSAGLLLLALAPQARAEDALSLGTKATYAPQQDPASYEAAPAGFVPVHTQLVARHGSRGLSSSSNDLAFYNTWLAAQSQDALTKLGTRLGPELQRLMRANALLGYRIPGISAPGYGNLSQLGIAEHQQLARRMAQRVAPLFEQAVALQRQTVLANSGVNRALDSANYFKASLAAAVPGLAPSLVNAAALTAYPVNNPVAQQAGVNRFELYFHKLAASTDRPATTDRYYAVYQDSLAYQSYLATDLTMLAKVNGLLSSSAARSAARAVMLSVFKPAFVDALDSGAASYANTGSNVYTSDDGLFTTTVTGNGQTKIASALDGANALYALYSIIPAMVNEAPMNLGKYFPDGTLPVFGYLSDVQDFYQKGPGIQEAGSVNSKMGKALLDDFFAELDSVAAGNLARAAKLRFTHAEIIIPFATLLGWGEASAAVPAAQDYSYAGNPWRGQRVSPLAANVQWDAVRNPAGTLLVKMLYNEQEADFKPACDSARYFAGSSSHWYDYSRLRACYGYAGAATRSARSSTAEATP